MKVLLTGASGFVGAALRWRLESDGHEVARVVRRAPEKGQAGLDLTRETLDLSMLDDFGEIDAVFHLAGEPLRLGRWGPKKRHAIMSSRTLVTDVLARGLAGMERPPKALVSMSATGYYGARGEERLEEGSRSGSGFLAEVCRGWEAATMPASDAGIRVVNTRMAPVIGKGGGPVTALSRVFGLGLGGRLGSGRQWTSFIALDDAVSALVYLATASSIAGPVNLASPNPVRNEELTAVLSKRLGRPAVLRIPRMALVAALGRIVTDEFVLVSQNVAPVVLKRSGFAFVAPSFDTALASSRSDDIVTEKPDVLVVGAGPAGSAAAITLGEQGLDVEWCDRAHFPRDKVCGDGLTTGALRHLEVLGLDVARLDSFRASTDLVMRSPSGRFADLALAKGPGVFAGAARRAELDQALVERGASLGVVLHDGEAFAELNLKAERLEVQLSSGRLLHPRYVVAADGAWSQLRRAVSSFPVRLVEDDADWHAFRGYVRTDRDEALEHLHVWFERRELPGYRWSFPVGPDVVNIGVCLVRAPGSLLNASSKDLLKSPYLTSLVGPEAALEAPLRSWPIPAGTRADTLSAARGRVLFVGDAARACDPFTGEGIAQALETGMLAGRCLADPSSKDPASCYSAIVLRTLARGQSLSRLCRAVARHQIGARGAVRLLAANDRFASLVGRWLYDDVPKHLIVSPGAWRGPIRNRPGPFSAPKRDGEPA